MCNRMNVGFQRSEVTLQVLMTAETNFTGWWLTYPSEKYEFVNGKDENPYMKWTKKSLKPPARNSLRISKMHRLNKKTKLSFLDILTCIDDHWCWFTALTFLSPKIQLQNPSKSSWTKREQFPASKNNLISQLLISLKYTPNQIHMDLNRQMWIPERCHLVRSEQGKPVPVFFHFMEVYCMDPPISVVNSVLCHKPHV